MRLTPPLLVGLVLASVVAALVARREAALSQALGAHPVTTEPLVALPWDRTVGLGLGNVRVRVPVRWQGGTGPALAAVAIDRDPDDALGRRLASECAHPVVLRWRDQWRGECLSRSGTRVRTAVMWVDGGWHGVEARYPDRLDARYAPRVSRMLASLHAD